MDWCIALALWVAGFFAVRSNFYYILDSAASPAWLQRGSLVLNIRKTLALALFIASAALLYHTGIIDFHWAVVVILTIVLMFATSHLAFISARNSFAKKHPDLFK